MSHFSDHRASLVDVENSRVQLEREARTKAANFQPSHSLRILVLEDHLDTLRVLLLYLRQLGHVARGAPTIREALRIADEWTFDTLISDIGLGDGDGCNFAREMLVTKRFVAIAMSGMGGVDEVERSLAAGFEHHLIKPFDPAKLEAMLTEISQRPPAG